jgi:tRNA wybutosine-synthesizing protein 3
LLKKAREAGFKHSGLLASSGRGYLVELITGIWIDIPIKTADRILINRSEIKPIVDILNNALREGRERLSSLKKILRELADTISTQQL